MSKTDKNPDPLGADVPVQELNNEQIHMRYNSRDRCYDEKSHGGGSGWGMSVSDRSSGRPPSEGEL